MGQLQIGSQLNVSVTTWYPSSLKCFVLCFWGCWFCWLGDLYRQLFLVVAAANAMQRQPANAGPCALWVEYLCTSPVWPRWGMCQLAVGWAQSLVPRSHLITALWDMLLGWEFWTLTYSKAPRGRLGPVQKSLFRWRVCQRSIQWGHLPFSLQGSLIQRLPPTERGIIQSEITDNWQDPCPRKSPMIVTNVWSAAGLQCSASCPASPAAASAAGPAAAWPCLGAAGDSLLSPELGLLTVFWQGHRIRSG